VFVIGICDDVGTLCGRVEEWILKRYGNSHLKVRVEVFLSGEDLLRYLESGENIDLLFLDIELGEINGVEVGRHIREDLSNEAMHIVYISAMQSYAMELFNNRPLNFLVKPLDREKIFACVEKALELSGSGDLNFQFKSKGDIVRLPYSSIVYFHSRDKKIIVSLRDDTFVFYGKLSEIENQLPKSFIRIHKSYLVNHVHIKKYDYDTITMTNEVILPISQPNRKMVRRHIMNAIRID
jgi:DNA-binding LytR/AlgR family response regulator